LGNENLVVLDSFPADQGVLSWEKLGRLGRLTLYPRTRRDEVVERSRRGTAVFTNKVVLDAELLAALPKLRYIGIQATGTNVVDLAEAGRRGIAVTNVANYSTESVAQFVFALLLHVLADVAGHAQRVKAGMWARSGEFCFFQGGIHELAGQTLLVVGKGAIGSAVARIAQGFGMRAIAAQLPGRTPSASEEDGVPRLALYEALAQSDVVSLHCPLTDETRNLVDDAFLAHCKPGAILVNTARGGLIDESALLRALDSERLAAAALDVLNEEPASEAHPLVSHPRAIVTSHMAWATEEARRRLIDEIAENYAAFLRGESRNRVALP